LQTLTEYVTGFAVSPDYAHDGTLLATTYEKGAYMSTDGGATWRPRDVGLGSPSGSKFAPIFRMFDVAFSPNYSSDGTIFTANWWNVMKSTDRGASWTPSTVGTLPASTLRHFVIA